MENNANHFWYLSKELVVLASLEKSLSLKLKEEMVAALKENSSVEEPQRRCTFSEKFTSKCSYITIRSAGPIQYYIIFLEVEYFHIFYWRGWRVDDEI